jgi:RNA polymerase sigma-70 factor (ECF subfamily)
MTALAIRTTPPAAMRDFATEWADAEPAIAAFLTSLAPNGHDAEDLLQRTAEGLLERWKEYDPARPFVAWALGSARIEVLRFRQERGRDRLVFDDDAIDALARAHTEHAAELAAAREALNGCVERLTKRLQQVLQLHHAEGHSVEHVAKRLMLSVGAVRVALSRARESVRLCIERALGEPTTPGGRAS